MVTPHHDNELDDWQFERIYSNLFSILVEEGRPDEKWQYDPLDSKYPVIDGILRRERKEPGDAAIFKHLPEFALIQLKETRFEEGNNLWPALRGAFSRRKNDGKANAVELVNSIALSCPAVLVGLSVDLKLREIEAAYIGAPEGYPLDRKPELRIERNDLLNAIAGVLEALRPTRSLTVLPAAPIKSVIFPRAKELVYFNQKEDGTVSVGESGLIFGKNISINWTIPRGIAEISIDRILGSPTITAEPVALPRPPYHGYQGRTEVLTEGVWRVHNLPGIANENLWWVLQVRFENCEATVKVEARA